MELDSSYSPTWCITLRVSPSPKKREKRVPRSVRQLRFSLGFQASSLDYSWICNVSSSALYPETNISKSNHPASPSCWQVRSTYYYCEAVDPTRSPLQLTLYLSTILVSSPGHSTDLQSVASTAICSILYAIISPTIFYDYCIFTGPSLDAVRSLRPLHLQSPSLQINLTVFWTDGNTGILSPVVAAT